MDSSLSLLSHRHSSSSSGSRNSVLCFDRAARQRPRHLPIENCNGGLLSHRHSSSSSGSLNSLCFDRTARQRPRHLRIENYCNGGLVRSDLGQQIGGVVAILSSRSRGASWDFAGLRRKMSSSEGLQKRIRDPQLAASEAKGTATKTRNYVASQISKPGVKSLIVFVGVPLLLGSINALFNSPSSQWFSDLKKPWWEPPGPIFGAAWSFLYPLMGLASWLVWAEGGLHKHGLPLTLYIVQLVLNLLWPMFFFGWKNLGLALVDILILDGVLAATINAFQPVNHVAANLLKPYLAWVLFATVLNFNLWLSNRGGAEQPAQ